MIHQMNTDDNFTDINTSMVSLATGAKRAYSKRSGMTHKSDNDNEGNDDASFSSVVGGRKVSQKIIKSTE